MLTSNPLTCKVFHSITEIDPVEWNQLSAGRPFTSHRWYHFCETVMKDVLPTYLLIYHDEQAIAWATFWRSPNEPLAIQSVPVRNFFQPLIRRWPLLLCESPFASISGIVLPEPPLRQPAQALISAKSIEFLHQQGCSFLVFSYLPKELSEDWSKDLLSTAAFDAGTSMQLPWENFEAYLQAGDKKDRQHYKRTLREAEKLGIQITRHTNLQHVNVAEALVLIRTVEHRFQSAENPWAHGMLEHFEMLQGATFLTATIGDRLVGCGLIVEDNGAQTSTILGLVEDVNYVYLMLVYESIKIAFDHHLHLVRLGTGAYDVKQHLGFTLENNNLVLFSAANPLLQKTAQWLEKRIG